MADLKNQHFVPKVHLAPFTTNGDRKSISLYAISKDKLVNGAAIKRQCSGAYFYGQDLEFEKLLGQLEGRYATLVREIETGSISKEAQSWLRIFMAIQEYRTLKAVETYKEFLERSAAIKFRGKAIKEAEEVDYSPIKMVMGCLKQFKSSLSFLRDLDLCVLVNRTKHSFVTSDDPLIHANRFHAQKIRVGNYGVISAGCIFALPLTPRLIACLYDSGVYSISTVNGFADIAKETDAIAFNDFQYLWADRHVYFADPKDGEAIREAYLRVAHRRPTARTKFTEFGEYKKDNFRRLDEQSDEGKLLSKMTMFETPRPQVERWPSIFHYKLRPRSFTNGSSIGYVRHPQWLTREGIDKEKL